MQDIYKTGKASEALEKRFNTKNLTIALERDRGEYWGRFKQRGDRSFNWHVRGDDGSGTDMDFYIGKVLVRKGKVLYYDRYPFTNRRLRIGKIPEKNMKEIAKIISKDIENILQ